MRLYLLFSIVITLSSAAAKRPNVIIIYSDDQGSIDLNCYGSEDLQTPHMDSLARDGVRFTQFYAAAPVCSPSRAGLMTGMVPARAGVPSNVGLQNEGLASKHITLAEEFKIAGYATACIGKWHIGSWPTTLPNNQGFDYFFGHRGGCIDNYSHFFYWAGPNKHDLFRNQEEVFHPGEYFPALMLDEASSFIEAQQGKPFFLYYALNSPHYPYQGSKEWLEHYKDLPYPRNLYAAFLSTQDEYIGKLLQKLEHLGIRNDTIIVFQSDHGHSVEVRAHKGGGNSGVFRGHKGNLYEGGLRVPAMISWRGSLPEGQVRTALSTSCDWYPTLLELAGLPQANHQIDGKSIVPVISSKQASSPHQQFHWQYSKQTAMRDGDWKLIITNGKSELFNLQHDLGEQNNLADQNKERLRAMEQSSKDFWSQLHHKAE